MAKTMNNNSDRRTEKVFRQNQRNNLKKNSKCKSWKNDAKSPKSSFRFLIYKCD